jgi:signal transduction histidine kinase
VLPVVVGAIQVIGCRIAERGQPEALPLDAVAYLLLLAGPAALLVRRRWPLAALGVALAATVTYLVQGYPEGPLFLASIVALFTAVQRAHRPTVWALSAAAYLTFVALGHRSVGEYVVVGAWSAVAVVLAEAARVRGQHFAELARTRAEATRARQEQSRREASDERLRIARELHDVLGHHLSLINVRSGVALHLLDSKPEQAREALSAIKLASAEALREMRGVLAALQVRDESAPRSPAPGLAGVEALAEETRAAGIDVALHLEGEPVELPGELDRAAYRIIQEALTNVRRHAGPAAKATITIGYGDQILALRVENTGPNPPPSTSDEASGQASGQAADEASGRASGGASAEAPGVAWNGAGTGIPGMRERAAALGGTLTTEVLAGGGFRVAARLPLNPRLP